MPKTSTISMMIARTVAYTAALVMLAWATTAAGGVSSANANSGAQAGPAAVQTAGLLVPRRTRLVIKFERTAVC
jgi:hypothetical protein